MIIIKQCCLLWYRKGCKLSSINWQNGIIITIFNVFNNLHDISYNSAESECNSQFYSKETTDKLLQCFCQELQLNRIVG